LKTRKCSK